MLQTLSLPRFPTVKFDKQSRVGRGGILVGLVPAGTITIGLFLMMNALIQVEGDDSPQQPATTLEPYYAAPEIETAIPRRIKPTLIETVVSPEVVAPVVLTAIPESVPIVFTSPPAELDPTTNPIPFGLQPSAIENRDVKPMRGPMVSYPQAAQRDGIEGSCDVTLDVTPQGRPYNVAATCTHRVFIEEAERAVRNVQFQPGVSDGRQVGWRGVVYPIEFSIES